MAVMVMAGLGSCRRGKKGNVGREFIEKYGQWYISHVCFSSPANLSLGAGVSGLG
jgi:hypothetical protein